MYKKKNDRYIFHYNCLFGNWYNVLEQNSSKNQIEVTIKKPGATEMKPGCMVQRTGNVSIKVKYPKEFIGYDNLGYLQVSRRDKQYSSKPDITSILTFDTNWNDQYIALET